MTFRRLAASTVALAIVVLALTLAVLPGDNPAPRAPAPTVTLGGPGTATIPAEPAPSAVGDDSVLDHKGSRDETPDGIPARTRAARQAGLEDLARADQLPLTSPDAAPQVPGCVSRFVRNYSTRGGVRPRELVAHYTVSYNRPGWDDVWGIVGLFDRSSFAASSNFVIDAEGHCAYIVRDTDKAWTQAAANPYAISIEFIAYGNEGALSAAQLAKGGQVFAAMSRRWNIPVGLGAVRNCLPSRAGILDHAMLGACGGGHHDIEPLFGGYGASDAHRLAPLIAATRAALKPTPRPITARDRRRCARVHAFRQRRRAHQPRTTSGVRRQHQRLHTNQRLGLTCRHGKVRRR